MSTKYLERPEGTIAYEEIGSGPLVIGVPSMGDVRAQYRFLAPTLAQAGYRVVSMDVRGHGESSVGWPDYSVAAIGSDILALARALDAGPAIVMGSSMAAGAAIWAAVEAPEQVTGLVLLGPAVRGDTSAGYRLLYRLVFARLWGAAFWATYYNKLYPTRKPADLDAYRAALRANLSQPGRLADFTQMMLASKAASAERVAAVNTPALVLMGSKDPDFKDPAAEARWLADSLQARLQIVEGAGHYPHVEMPEVAAPLILSFLQALREDTRRLHAA